MIKFFSNKEYFSRTSGNVLNGILTLSVRQKDASGIHLGPFSCFATFFYFGGIIGCPFRHNRLSWRHNRLSWRHKIGCRGGIIDCRGDIIDCRGGIIGCRGGICIYT